MARRSYTEQLESVQSTIAQIEATPNRAVTVLGRTFTKHDLQVLYNREKWLLKRVAREMSGGPRVVQVVPIS